MIAAASKCADVVHGTWVHLQPQLPSSSCASEWRVSIAPAPLARRPPPLLPCPLTNLTHPPAYCPANTLLRTAPKPLAIPTAPQLSDIEMAARRFRLVAAVNKMAKVRKRLQVREAGVLGARPTITAGQAGRGVCPCLGSKQASQLERRAGEPMSVLGVKPTITAGQNGTGGCVSTGGQARHHCRAGGHGRLCLCLGLLA